MCKAHNVFPSCQASGPSPKSKKPPSKQVASSAVGASKKAGEAKKNGKQQANNGDMSEDDPASAGSTPKKAAKDANRKRKPEEGSPALQAANQESPVSVKRAKTARDNNRDLGLCRYEPLTQRPLAAISAMNQSF